MCPEFGGKATLQCEYVWMNSCCERETGELKVGISFRKRIGTGKPGRINVSKGGLGGSIGSKAGRFGVSSAGTPYVRGGSNGVYYRSEASNSSGPTSSSPTSGSKPSQTPSDSAVIGANMPMYELLDEYSRLTSNLTSLINQMSFRMGKGSVIQDCQKRYISAVVNHETRGTFTESERAWNALAIKYNEKESVFAPLDIVGQRQQQLTRLDGTRSLEPYRTDFESLARDEATCAQAIRSWCAEFDNRWNTLVELRWLPRLGQS
jgi:hypothetical protein